MTLRHRIAAALAATITAGALVGITAPSAHATCGVKNSTSSTHYMLVKYSDLHTESIGKGKSSGCGVIQISTGDGRYIATPVSKSSPVVGSGWTDISGMAWNFSTWYVRGK